MIFSKGLSLIYKKELKSLLGSPITFFFLGVFSFFAGVIFYSNLLQVKELTNKNVIDNVLNPTFSAMNFLLMIVIPMLTMGSFVKEKKEGTLSLLRMSKVTSLQIFSGKYLSFVSVSLLLILPTLVFPIIVSFSGFSDWAMVLTNYLGLTFLILCYVVVGLFSSLMSKNYFISILLAFGILFSFLILYSTGLNIPNEILGEIVRYISLGQHTYYFFRGALASFDFVYFLSFIGFFSYMGVKIMELKE